MDINVVDKGNQVFVVELNGSVKLENIKMLRESFKKLVDEHKNKIIVDLKDLNYIDSSGLGAMITTKKKVSHNNGDVVFINVHDKIREIISPMGILGFFKVFDTETAAIDYFK